MVPWLSELELSMRRRPSSDLSCSSCSSMISRSISWGLAPGQKVVTLTSGSSTLGVSWTGMRKSARTPNITSRITPTAVVTGNRMAESMIFTAARTPRPAARTAWPGRSRSLPRVTTRAPGSSPLLTSTQSPTPAPVSTGTGSTVSSSFRR